MSHIWDVLSSGDCLANGSSPGAAKAGDTTSGVGKLLFDLFASLAEFGPGVGSAREIRVLGCACPVQRQWCESPHRPLRSADELVGEAGRFREPIADGAGEDDVLRFARPPVAARMSSWRQVWTS